MTDKSSAGRNTILTAMLLCILLLTSCSTTSMSKEGDSGQKPVNDSKPYQNVTLLVSDYSLSDADAAAMKETLKKNLMGYYGLPEEKADHLLKNGKFELRFVEAGDEKLDDNFLCRYYSSAMITVWKSEGYFAVCKTDHANFIPYITSKQVVSIKETGTAWSDAEEGYLMPKIKSELIPVVIGKTIAVNREGEADISSKLYLKKMPVAFGPYPVNESGETYGSTALSGDLGEAPDLISLAGIFGAEGYVRKCDLEEALPKTAVGDNGQHNVQKFARRIPVYQSDGHTFNGFIETAKIQRLIKYTENSSTEKNELQDQQL